MSTELQRAEEESFGRLHGAAAFAAGIVSAVIHAIIFLWLGSFIWPMNMRAIEALKQKWERPMRLIEVTRAAALPSGMEAGSPDGFEGGIAGEGGGVLRGNGTEGEDLGKTAELLAIVPGQALTEPPVMPASRLTGEGTSVAEATPVPERGKWEPRREILAVEQRKASEEARVMPRRWVDLVERYRKAPDIVPPANPDELLLAAAAAQAATGTGSSGADDEMWPARMMNVATGGVPEGVPGLRIGRPRRSGDDQAGITPHRPVEKLLRAEVSTYKTLFDLRYLYFRIRISRIDTENQPVIPKDIMIVQDSSASIAEQRLFFCRVGWLSCLGSIGDADRFNVMRFRNHAEFCFSDWVPRTPENLERAKRFVQEMKSVGETDIYGSIRELVNVGKTHGRPVVVYMVSDGHATTGMRRSSEIIGEFSKLNEGAVSVFTLGTCQTANSYLLDLLSYCNRGASVVVNSGRWDIPTVMADTMAQIRRPVMSELRFRFDSQSQCDVYPVQTENLYLDRALVLYGRCPRTTKQLVFQAAGQAADVLCDMVFRIDLENDATAGDKSIRTLWARQKVYHLMGRYARQPDPGLIREMEQTAEAYGIEFPYRREL